MTKYIFLLFILPQILFAQKGAVAGKVSENGNPMPGVNIFIPDSFTGTVSEEDGSYRLENVSPGDIRIRFSAVGFRTENFTVTIEADRTLLLDVEMEPEVIEVEQIEVTDRRIQSQDDTRTSVIDLSPKSAKTLPGAVTDVFRTLQSLPGVLAPSDFSSQLIIRGSGPDQNLIVMDNVEIFNPYRLYGVVSMFNPEAVSDIELITGGFPARYGDRLSAVLDITNKQGSRSDNLKGSLNASIVSANLVLEGKNPFDIPGSWLVNSRRTYYDLIIEPFVKDAGLVEDNVSFPNFHDVQAKFTFGPFNGNKFFLNGIYSRDGVNIVSGDERQTPDSISVFDLSKNDMASFAWHHARGENLLNKFIVSWYRNSGDTDFDSQFLDPSLNRDNFEDASNDTLSAYLLGFGFNTEYSFRKYSFDERLIYYWGENEFEAGAGLDLMQTTLSAQFDLDPQLQAFLESNPNINAAIDDILNIKNYSRARVYLQNRFNLFGKINLQPGLRTDYYEILDKFYAAPRFSMSYALDDITTLRGVWGIYYQSPGYEKIRDQNVFLDLDQRFTRNINAEKAVHYVLGIDRWVTNEWKIKAEAYYKDFTNLIVPKVARGINYYTESIGGKDPRLKNSWTRPVPVIGDSITQIPVNNSFGESYGVELLLEKRNIYGKSKFNGWISYAYAFANRFEDGIKIPFRYDQRHTFNLVMDYKATSWFDFSLRFQYGSGFPTTVPVGFKPRIILQDSDGDQIPDDPDLAVRRNFSGATDKVIFDVDYGGRKNQLSQRLPVYHRLDLRFNFYAEYWDLDWIFYLDIINVYNRSNVINYDYFVNDDLNLEREATSMFPILPTIGFSIKF